jgi:hypothetical protein
MAGVLLVATLPFLPEAVGRYSYPGPQTKLVANPLLVDVLPGATLGVKIYVPHLSARLTTTTGLPLPGRSINFFIAGKPACSAYTGPDGTAECVGGDQLIATLRGGYLAVFNGDTFFSSSRDTGPIAKVAGIDIGG